MQLPPLGQLPQRSLACRATWSAPELATDARQGSTPPCRTPTSAGQLSSRITREVPRANSSLPSAENSVAFALKDDFNQIQAKPLAFMAHKHDYTVTLGHPHCHLAHSVSPVKEQPGGPPARTHLPSWPSWLLRAPHLLSISFDALLPRRGWGTGHGVPRGRGCQGRSRSGTGSGGSEGTGCTPGSPGCGQCRLPSDRWRFSGCATQKVGVRPCGRQAGRGPALPS